MYLKIGPNWQCCLAGSSKTAPRIFIFSIVLGAEYLSYVKYIETHARTFLPLNISAIGNVFMLNVTSAKSAFICHRWQTAGFYLGLIDVVFPKCSYLILCYDYSGATCSANMR